MSIAEWCCCRLSQVIDQHVAWTLHICKVRHGGIAKAGRHHCRSCAKVSALLVYFCTRNHDSQQSTSVQSRKKGPRTRCDTKRATAAQSTQNRSDGTVGVVWGLPQLTGRKSNLGEVSPLSSGGTRSCFCFPCSCWLQRNNLIGWWCAFSS